MTKGAFTPPAARDQRNRAAPASLLALTAFVHLCLTTTSPAQRANLDDVACALCHFEQGDDFATSVHFQKGLMLCDDCHGGLAFELDSELSKAPVTGFTGRPSREEIAGLCASCHIGPARFFARGPHHEVGNPANPTCITCHSNHAVQNANLDLLDASCESCHENGTAERTNGDAIAVALTTANADLAASRTFVDSLVGTDRELSPALALLESAASTLRETDPATHALDRALIDEKLELFRQDLAALETAVDGYFETRRQRKWITLGVWVFIGINVTLLWVRRRHLE